MLTAVQVIIEKFVGCRFYRVAKVSAKELQYCRDCIMLRSSALILKQRCTSLRILICVFSLATASCKCAISKMCSSLSDLAQLQGALYL